MHPAPRRGPLRQGQEGREEVIVGGGGPLVERLAKQAGRRDQFIEVVDSLD